MGFKVAANAYSFPEYGTFFTAFYTEHKFQLFLGQIEVVYYKDNGGVGINKSIRKYFFLLSNPTISNNFLELCSIIS
jgi:hypothetical protein